MSAPVVARIRRSTTRAIDEAFSEMWAAKQLDAMATEAEQTIAECLDYPAKADALYHAGWRAAIPAIQQNRPVDWYGRGVHLREQFDSSLDVLQTVRKWVRALEEAGRTVANAPQLEEAIAAMERVRAALRENWPWAMTAEESAEVEAEIKGGAAGWLPLDETFAEVAGVSVEEWLRRVEEHKRRYGL
jgi:hypothetical protein